MADIPAMTLEQALAEIEARSLFGDSRVIHISRLGDAWIVTERFLDGGFSTQASGPSLSAAFIALFEQVIGSQRDNDD